MNDTLSTTTDAPGRPTTRPSDPAGGPSSALGRTPTVDVTLPFPSGRDGSRLLGVPSQPSAARRTGPRTSARLLRRRRRLGVVVAVGAGGTSALLIGGLLCLPEAPVGVILRGAGGLALLLSAGLAAGWVRVERDARSSAGALAPVGALAALCATVGGWLPVALALIAQRV